jgi:hypothetical protein
MTILDSASLDIRGHLGSARVRTALRGLTHLSARSFFASVMIQVLAVMVLVEAIFLAERFPMVFRDVLKNNADLLDTSLIFACTTTQIFDLALAIAILMAVYWTTLRMRENRELLVLFTAGTGPYQLTALTLAIALVAQVGSLTVSSVIDPTSRYAQRVILFDAELHALKSGISTGKFYYFPNRVAFAPAISADGQNPAGLARSQTLFVHDESEPGRQRIITADRAGLDGPDPSGNILLRLGGFTSHTFANAEMEGSSTATPPQTSAPQTSDGACSDCPDQRAGTVYASDVVQQIVLEDLLPFPARGSDAVEWTIFDQLTAKADTAPAKLRDEMRLLGERFARSLLCLLAPLIALASVCLTSRATNYFALPAACMALMLLNVASEWLIRAIAPTEMLGALAVPALLTAGFMAILLVMIIRGQGELVRPQLSRA